MKVSEPGDLTSGQERKCSELWITLSTLTACWTRDGQDLAGGLLAAEDGGRRHEEPRHPPLLGGGGAAGLGRQEQVVPLAALEIHLVDAGLQILPRLLRRRPRLRPPGLLGGPRLQEQQLDEWTHGGLASCRLALEYLEHLKYFFGVVDFGTKLFFLKIKKLNCF